MTSTKYIGMDVRKESISIGFGWVLHEPIEQQMQERFAEIRSPEQKRAIEAGVKDGIEAVNNAINWGCSVPSRNLLPHQILLASNRRNKSLFPNPGGDICWIHFEERNLRGKIWTL